MSHARQACFEFRSRGGARKGAGRKPAGPRGRVGHSARPRLKARHPVHVTLRVVEGLPNLRAGSAHRAVLGALAAGSRRFGLAVIHYSAQSNHVHLVCEADNEQALARGMKGICVRMARALNRIWSRTGSVFADRYHARVLGSPREVRNALAYVLGNAAHHGLRFVGKIDPCSSASWFDGWKRKSPPFTAVMRWCPFPAARTWLLTLGWRLNGPLEAPRPS